MMRFRVPVTLLQPSVVPGAQPTEHLVMGRRVDDGGGSRGIVDDTVAAPAGATWQVDGAPEGLGTRWNARVGGVVHQIDSVIQEEEMRPVWTLSLSSTALTGAVAIPGGSQPSGSPPAPPPAAHGGPGSGS